MNALARATALLFTVSFVPVLSVSSLGCGGGSTPCDLDVVLRQRAGAGAIDCGRVASGASSDITDQCVVDQAARAAPFYARYDVQGIDSQVALGVVRDPEGRSLVLTWDSDPSGGSQVGAQIIATLCGGDPPIRVGVSSPSAAPPVSCTMVISGSTICGG